MSGREYATRLEEKANYNNTQEQTINKLVCTNNRGITTQSSIQNTFNSHLQLIVATITITVPLQYRWRFTQGKSKIDTIYIVEQILEKNASEIK